MTTIAVMQPYFFPYAGYYRLPAAADVFVIFDCVQFPRRGWVHRNKLPRHDGELDWLTLPLKKPGYHDKISDLAFPDDAYEAFVARCRAFPLLGQLDQGSHDDPLIQAFFNFDGTVVDYLDRTLKEITRRLGFDPVFRRSSAMAIPPEIRGQDRVLAIVEACGGSRYINLSGGREYYDPARFFAKSIELNIFRPYEGSYDSVLTRVLAGEIDDIRREIRANLSFLD